MAVIAASLPYRCRPSRSRVATRYGWYAPTPAGERIDAAYEGAQTPEREIVEGLSGEWDLDG